MQERGRQHKQAPEREGECTLKNGKKTNCFQIENQILFSPPFALCSLARRAHKKKKNKIRKDWKTKRKETEQQQQNSINSTLILIRHLPVP